MLRVVLHALKQQAEAAAANTAAKPAKESKSKGKE
jgi:hypothetical protein